MTTHELLLAAKAAAPALAWLGSEEKIAAILRMADAIVRETDVILAANEAKLGHLLERRVGHLGHENTRGETVLDIVLLETLAHSSVRS